MVFTCRQPEPTPTPTVAPSPTGVPDETPAASQEITPAEPTSNTFVDEVRQTPVVTPRVESKRSTPSLTVKKQSKQQILRIVVTDKKEVEKRKMHDASFVYKKETGTLV